MDLDQEEFKKDKKVKLPKINDSDLVLAFFRGDQSGTLEENHILCAVHSQVLSEDKKTTEQVILKGWLRDKSEIDDRTFRLY